MSLWERPWATRLLPLNDSFWGPKMGHFRGLKSTHLETSRDPLEMTLWGETDRHLIIALEYLISGPPKWVTLDGIRRPRSRGPQISRVSGLLPIHDMIIATMRLETLRNPELCHEQ